MLERTLLVGIFGIDGSLMRPAAWLGGVGYDGRRICTRKLETIRSVVLRLGRKADGIIIVLCGGNKRTQRRDLQRAKEEISRVNGATLTRC
jgi:hypothetical protein